MAMKLNAFIDGLTKYLKPEDDIYYLWFERDLVEQYNDSGIPLTEEEWEMFEEIWHDTDLRLVDVFNEIINTVRESK